VAVHLPHPQEQIWRH
jgi:hypothetical protein